MKVSLCLHCGAEGDGDLPPGHEWGAPCPARGTEPCPLCGALPGEPCVITAPDSPRRGQATRDHAGRTTPSLGMDVVAPRSIGNVVDLAHERLARR